MEEWIYNNAVVEEHSLYPLCGSMLDEVSDRDYPGEYHFNPNLACLDMDTYEKNILRKSHANHTVDAVIGISTYENNRALNPRLLLVELRMDYKSTSNLSKTAMEEKVIYTKALLGGEKAINRKSLFIFNNNFAPQAKSWFDRQSRTGGELKYCIACSVSDSTSKIKSPSDFPYRPLHKEKEIKDSVQQYADKAEWINFFKQIKYWCRKAEEYRYKNPSESEHITNMITGIWKEMKAKSPTFNDDETLEALVIEEDFGYLNK